MSAGVRVGVIGMGNVGPAIASSLRAAGAQIVGVSARSEEARDRADAMLPGVPVLTEDEVGQQSEILFLAVPDGQIQSVTEQLVAGGGIRPGMVVAHLSGALGLDPLASASAIGAIPLALHPAMTFSGTSLDVRRLQGCPIAYTSSELARPVALALIEYLGGVPLQLDETERPRYHAGLAHASNHLVTLLVQAQDVLGSAGVDSPGEAMRPLVEAAVERALTEGIDGLTGPVVRGDDATVNAHIALLEADPELRDVARTYRSLAHATRVALRGDTAEPLVLHTREQLRRALEDDPRPTSLVMTMGALHAGHLSLVEQVARSGHKVVVTIFVNPEQFGEGEDFDSYPRTLDEDVAALAEVGVDIVYAPPVSEVYPRPSHVHITPGPASTVLEGALRPGHFAGVLQVVGKMMNLIRPNLAVFGQKDAQQFVNIRQMVEDLDIPLELLQAPIVRDEDGLALSSRNAYLSEEEKTQALALNRSLALGRELLEGEDSAEEAVAKVADYLSASPGIEAQYVALAAADSFEVAALWTGDGSSLGVENLTVLQPGSEAYLLVAAQVGPARLIDNVTVRIKADD